MKRDRQDQKRGSSVLNEPRTVLKSVPSLFLSLSPFDRLSHLPGVFIFLLFLFRRSNVRKTSTYIEALREKGRRVKNRPGVAIYSEFRNDQCFGRTLLLLLLHLFLFLALFLSFSVLTRLIEKEWKGREELGAILSYSYFAVPSPSPPPARAPPSAGVVSYA